MGGAEPARSAHGSHAALDAQRYAVRRPTAHRRARGRMSLYVYTKGLLIYEKTRREAGEAAGRSSRTGCVDSIGCKSGPSEPSPLAVSGT